MEKIIKFRMNDDKSISVILNEEEKFKITQENRQLNTMKIYELLDFHKGDHFNVLKENQSLQDENVLDFFFNMISEIAEQLNKIE